MALKNKIRRGDFERVLITETLPYETPIIFSNDGLYTRLRESSSAPEFEQALLSWLIKGGGGKKQKCTEPYHYKIRKGDADFRRLALLHPASQWRLRLFYEKYEQLILHFCNRSRASIRAPASTASFFYKRTSWENIYKYKGASVSTVEHDGYAKHMPSYFAYRGFDRLYKFFQSDDYLRLEAQYSIQMSLDVSKCFDSIYTHSIVWAVKDKEFAKTNLQVHSFGDAFDTVIRHGNHQETNGIPIGPEASRIFAEIVFQKVDLIAQGKLKDIYGVDYELRRYVDDVYIFARNETIAQAVYKAYADALIKFNLHANAAKRTLSVRPFVSAKSLIIAGVNECAKEFFDSFLSTAEGQALMPKEVRSVGRLSRHFVSVVKVVCGNAGTPYSEVSSYLISAITERVKRLVVVDGGLDVETEAKYCDALSVLVDVAFFLFKVAPSVSSSYKLAAIIILTVRFAREHLSSYRVELCHRLYGHVHSLFLVQCEQRQREVVENFVQLEFLNILLAAQELGQDYLLPSDLIEKLFLSDVDLAYFNVTSVLFYIRDRTEYHGLRKRIAAAVQVRLSDLDEVLTSSEKCHLLLDFVSCPFVLHQTRVALIRKLSSILGVAAAGPELLGLADRFAVKSWHVNWLEADLLSSLEKRELREAY